MTRAESEERAPAQQRWFSLATILVAFIMINHLHELASLSDSYLRLFDRYPFYVVLGGRDILVVLLCIGVVRFVWATSAAEAARELGITMPLTPGLVYGLGASAPMFIGLAIATPLASPPVSAEALYLSWVSPFAEEILFRGFLCGVLFMRIGMPAWAAAAISAVVFGWEHVDLGSSVADMAGLFLLTACGGFIFGWMFLRWRRNIWVPFLLHAGMNLAWNVFDVADTALGGWYPFSLQSGSMALAVAFTLLLTEPVERVRGVGSDPKAAAQRRV